MMAWDLYRILGFMFSWAFSMGIVNGPVLILYGPSSNIFTSHVTGDMEPYFLKHL